MKPKNPWRAACATCLGILVLGPHGSAHGAITFAASGADVASITGVVDAFRAGLGTLNANVAGSFGSGRREINWDGVPDTASAPNAFPAGFFNSNSPRGVVFATPGTGFQLSASAASGTPVDFGNIDPAYAAQFAPFSPQRLFTAIGSNIVDVSFFIPGSTTPAITSAFGAVFSDVDLAGTTSLQFFDSANASLGTFFVPSASGNETFSFLGVRFTAGEQVARVRITSGNQALAAGATSGDTVAMDDFIYAEPVLPTAAIPEPATGALVGLGLAALGWRVRKAR